MDQALESQWIAGAGQLGAEFFNGIDPQPPFDSGSLAKSRAEVQARVAEYARHRQ